MKFIPVDELPEQNRKTFKKRGGGHLVEFLNLKIKYAKMDISDMDYITPYSAYCSTLSIVKYHNLPIRARLINGELYLENLDITS